MTSEFKTYIQNSGFKVDDFDNANYFYMSGWKMYVPDDKQEEFLTNYYNLIYKTNQVSTLLEKPHSEYNQIRIDIDLKYLIKDKKDIENLNHRYNYETIKMLIERYIIIASEYFNIPKKGVKFTVFEKNKASVKGGIKNNEKYIKDGVHILCPDIVVSNTILLAIYDDIINDKQSQIIVSNFNTDEPINKIIDKSVICKNGWLILGSGKVDDKRDNYYQTSKTFNVKYDETTQESEVKEVKLDLNELEQIIHFSNYKKIENVKLHDDIDISVIEKRINSLNKKKPEMLTDIDKIVLKNQSVKNNKIVDLRYIGKLLKCLSPNRYTDYEEWFKVGVCLFNISSNLYTLFEKWSSQWKDFNRDDVYREWNTKISSYGNKYALGLPQLKRYAQSDNPRLYFNLVNEEKQNFIESMIKDIDEQPSLGSTKNTQKFIGALDMAIKIKDYIEFHCDWNVKCADPTSFGTWYKFENEKGIWKEDKGANKINKLFSGEILPALKGTFELYNSKLSDIQGQRIFNTNNNINDNFSFNSESITSIENNINPETDLSYMEHSIKSKIQTTKTLANFFQKPANRNSLIKDISQESYDCEFYSNLNENRNIFVCKNCVLDLERLEIRQGLPEDMSTIYTDIDFPIEMTEKDLEDMAMLNDLLDKTFPDFAVQEHVINIFAESLSGNIRREKFIIHSGSGSNGKSVMFELLSIMFGDYSYFPDATIFSFDNQNPNSVNPIIANCKGKRAIFASEPKANRPLNSNGIKRNTGGDKMTGRHLNKEPIEFKPQATWHMACNDIPELDYIDDGIERRLENIPYVSKFVSKSSPKLLNPTKYPNHYPKDERFRDDAVLKSLARQMLRKCWDRYIELNSIGFEPLLDEDKIPSAVTEFTKKYIVSSNIIDQFIAEKITEREGYRQKVKEIYNSFKKYCVDASISNVLKQSEFSKHFERRVGGRLPCENRVRYSYDYVLIDEGEEYEE